MQRVLGFIFAVLLGITTALAQSPAAIYHRASEVFERGLFHESDSILLHNLDNMNQEYRIAAYRLLSVSALQCDRKNDAEVYARKLLDENPYYTIQVNEFPRFADIIARLRGGSIQTIVTASQQAESLEEAPVPVTLITQEMIANSNARNIQELLYMYVPGISNLEGEEMNFSMRGLASYSQENVLVMLNGVRLNSYSTNAAALDYRLTLANIKQIEVLRGAASSLYGNVALTAVVNIITKSGADVNGVQVTAGGGSSSTYKASMLLGKKLVDSDIMVWASVYGSKGYRHDIAQGDMTDGYGIQKKPGYLYVNGYTGRPAYDFGLTYKWKKVSVQFSHNYGKRTYTYTNLHLPAMYDHDQYENIGGITPGRGVSMTNANVRYTNSWGKWTLAGDAYVNYETVNLYNIAGDKLFMPGYYADFFDLDLEQYPMMKTAQDGVYMLHNWNDYNLGASVKVMNNYDIKGLGKGNLLFGAQFDYFNLFYNDFSFGHMYGQTIFTGYNDKSQVFVNNHESNMSLYMQLKHYILPELVLNGGLRYDLKKRYSGESENVISPRVALIWSPTPRMNYKLSYARSFVDAPYFYRASSLVYHGYVDLDPEYLNNVQLNAIFTFPSAHLKYETNLFYNSAQDVIVLGRYYYENSGSLKSIGWENILTYEHKGWMLQGNLFMQRFLDIDPVSGSDDNKYAIPNVTARLNVAKSLFDNRLVLMANLSVSSSNRASMPDYVFCNGVPLPESGTYKTLPACFLADLGARYRLKMFDFDVKLKNITNQKYRLAGDRVPVLQEGFSVQGTITWNIK